MITGKRLIIDSIDSYRNGSEMTPTSHGGNPSYQSGDGPEKAHDEAHEAYDESRSQGKADSRPTQSATQSDDPVTRLLSALRGGALSPQALRQAVGLTHRQTFRMNYLRPALKAGFIERTIPGKPTSHLQKYRLTTKGRAWLAAHWKKIKDT